MSQITSNSYGGIVAAINELRAANGEARKEYPASFEGIRDAILDMKREWGNSDTGEYPPGWKPITDEDGNVIGGGWETYPSQGELWFDERQGRLMIWMNDAFYQTNGADVLTKVTNFPPATDVEGALWYEPDTATLYLYDGVSWVIVSSNAVNTAGLMLANPTTSRFKADRPFIPDTSGLVTQADLNSWVYDALIELEDNLGSGNASVSISDTPPNDPESGDLWFNSIRVELYIYLDNYWVPTAIPLAVQDDFQALTLQQSNTQQQLEDAITNLQKSIQEAKDQPHLTYTLSSTGSRITLKDSEGKTASLNLTAGGGLSVATTGDTITYSADALSSRIGAIESSYIQQSALTNTLNQVSALNTKVSELDARPVVLQTEHQQLAQAVSQLPSLELVNARLPINGGALFGELSMNGNRVTSVGTPTDGNDATPKSYVDYYINDITSNYVKSDRPSFETIVIDKLDISKPGFDFSGSPASGFSALKFNTNDAVGDHYVTFGTNTNPWEYAWSFSGNEDFCWKHDSNKVFSITKDGPVCRNLTIGTFLPNTQDGTVILNKIDVKERITTYENALQGIRTSLSTAADFDEFKTAALDALAGL